MLYLTHSSLAQLPWLGVLLKCSWRQLSRQTPGDTVVMRCFIFTEEDVQSFQFERYYHPDPRVQRKMEVLWLKSQGFTHEDIAHTAGVSRRTVQRYLDEYQHGGIEELQTVTWNQPQSELAKHRTTLAKY